LLEKSKSWIDEQLIIMRQEIGLDTKTVEPAEAKVD